MLDKKEQKSDCDDCDDDDYEEGKEGKEDHSECDQARLMECLDKEGNHNDILATYSTLQTVDPLRCVYLYKLRAEVKIQKKVNIARHENYFLLPLC